MSLVSSVAHRGRKMLKLLVVSQVLNLQHRRLAVIETLAICPCILKQRRSSVWSKIELFQPSMSEEDPYRGRVLLIAYGGLWELLKLDRRTTRIALGLKCYDLWREDLYPFAQYVAFSIIGQRPFSASVSILYVANECSRRNTMFDMFFHWACLPQKLIICTTWCECPRQASQLMQGAWRCINITSSFVTVPFIDILGNRRKTLRNPPISNLQEECEI